MALKIKKTKVKILLLLLITIVNSSIAPFLRPLTAFATQEQTKENSKVIDSKEKYLQEDNYIIGPGDIIELKLFDAPEFSGNYKVLNDGSINLPLIGNFHINHLTLNKASKFIEIEYGKQLLRPELYLNLKTARPIIISIIGEIKRPGIYSLTNNETTQLEESSTLSNKGLPKVTDAIQKAGGILKSANLKEVAISRKLPGNGNEYKKTSIDLLDLILNGNHSQNIFLFDGDIIRIAKAKKLSQESMQIAQANLSPDTININVIGQVNKPGRMKVMANTPLVQSVFLAGGPIAWKANKGDIELIRVNQNGSITRRSYQLNLSDGVSLDKNPPLKDGDIVNVNPTSLQKISTGLGAIADPITPIISGFSLLKLLSN